MTTIETFCRVCAEPVDIPASPDDDKEISEAFARIGVACDKCAAEMRRKNSVTQKKPVAPAKTNYKPQQYRVTAPHNDP